MLVLEGFSCTCVVRESRVNQQGLMSPPAGPSSSTMRTSCALTSSIGSGFRTGTATAVGLTTAAAGVIVRSTGGWRRGCL